MGPSSTAIRGLCCVGLLALTSCAEEPTGPAASDETPEPPAAPGPPGPPAITGLSLAPAVSVLDPGEALQLEAVYTHEDGTESTPESLLWSTTDPSVATVSSTGMITAVEAGEVEIVASGEGQTARVEMHVRLYVSQVSVGGMHACFLTPRGAAFCWGDNRHGELGTGDYAPAGSPVRVATGYTLKSIAAAGGFTCAVAQDDRGYCWGDDSMMELGSTVPGKSSPIPVAIAGSITLSSISGSHMAHACALALDGTAWCWGYNRFGMVGHGIQRDEPEPIPVDGGLAFKSLHSGFLRTCGVTTAGDPYCWGRGGPAQIGNPTAAMDVCGVLSCALAPMPSAQVASFQSVTTGRMHSCALTDNGDVHCWGENGRGQLGVGGTGDMMAPTMVSLPVAASEVTAGRDHTCALGVDGRAFCWGDGEHGQLGIGTWADSDMPVEVAGGLSFGELSAGFDQTCGVTADEHVFCWGENARGQLGQGASGAPSNTPLAIDL